MEVDGSNDTVDKWDGDQDWLDFAMDGAIYNLASPVFVFW